MRRLLPFCLAMDAGFIALHLAFLALKTFGLAPPPTLTAAFDISQDGAWPEIWQYLKWAAILALLLWPRRALPAALALLFATILADDALALHERLGIALAPHLPALPLLRGQDGGELLAWACLGLLVLAPLALLYPRSPAPQRQALRPLLQGLGLLLLFALGLDMVHAALIGEAPLSLAAKIMDRLLGSLEDGGEMIVASLLLARAAALRLPAPVDAGKFHQRAV